MQVSCLYLLCSWRYVECNRSIVAEEGGFAGLEVLEDVSLIDAGETPVWLMSCSNIWSGAG
jgi:hypothetical protein